MAAIAPGPRARAVELRPAVTTAVAGERTATVQRGPEEGPGRSGGPQERDGVRPENGERPPRCTHRLRPGGQGRYVLGSGIAEHPAASIGGHLHENA